MSPESPISSARRRNFKTRPRGFGRQKRPTVPPEQRKRVKVACISCRQNKNRCDGLTPCRRCVASQRLCLYATLGSQASLSHPKPDENSGERPDSRNDASENNKSRTSANSFVSSADHCSSRTTRSTNVTVNDQSGDLAITLHPPAISQDPNDLNNSESVVLDGSPIPTGSVTVVSQGKTHFEGRFSYWTFFDSVKQVVAEDLEDALGPDEQNGSGPINQLSTYSLVNLQTAVTAALPPREVVEFLESTFFQFAQANFFYIHPEIFCRKLTAFYNGSNDFDIQNKQKSRRSTEFLCVLFMVLAIGSQFAEVGSDSAASDHGNRCRNASDLDLSSIVVPIPSPNPGWHFYEVSHRLLPDVMCSSSMMSVQACVLQGIFLPSTNNRDAGYNLLGLALRMAINMGMHRSLGASSLHPHVRELRNRLWWSVYIAERLFSIEMGRPLPINDAEIDAPFPVHLSDWNLLAPPLNVDGLISMAKLCQLLGDIVDSIYRRQSNQEGTMMQPEVISRLRREIERSKETLAGKLRSGNELSRSLTHLQLSYEQATILLTRSCLNLAALKSNPKLPNEKAKNFVHKQAKDCVRAAISSIKLMRSLQSRSLLCRFSFHDSVYCSASIYVLLLSRKLYKMPETVPAAIRDGITILLELAKGSESAGSALKYVLRACRSHLNDRDIIAFTQDNPSDRETMLENGRRSWREWIKNTLNQNQIYPSSCQTSLDDRTISHTNHDIGLDAPSSITAMRLKEHNVARKRDDNYDSSQTTHSASTTDEVASDLIDLQPFWIPDHPEFDIQGRDLTEALLIPFSSVDDQL